MIFGWCLSLTLLYFQTQCVLVQSKELTLQASDAQRVFGSDSFSTAVDQGKHCFNSVSIAYQNMCCLLAMDVEFKKCIFNLIITVSIAMLLCYCHLTIKQSIIAITKVSLASLYHWLNNFQI